MLKCLNNDNKLQMRLNIIQHRQKLLKYLENTDDIVLKPKIKLILNNLEKFNLKHNVKPKMSSSAEFQNPKLEPIIKITNYNTRSTVRVHDLESVKNTTANLQVLTDIDIKQLKPRSTVTINQLQSHVIVKLQDELPLSNVELQLEPIPNNEIKDPEPPPAIVKKLKDILLEELLDHDEIDDNLCSEESNDDTISIGSNENWNAIFQTHDDSDVDENDRNNLSLIESVKYDGHKQSANEKRKKEYLNYSGNSDSSVLDINYSTNKKRESDQKKNGKKFIKTSDGPQMDLLNKTETNAKEQANRKIMANNFVILSKCCSYLKTNRLVPSKHSILLAAKKECELLKLFEKNMLAEQKIWSTKNEILCNRIAKIQCKDNKDSRLARLN